MNPVPRGSCDDEGDLLDEGVIRRKVAAAQGPATARGPGGAEKAWPQELVRASRDCCNLALDVPVVQAKRYSLSELLELVPELSLIALLEGPRSVSGVLFLNAEMLAGLIEAQTLGRVMPQAPAPRKPTRTDAAIVADWIDRMLSGLEEALLTEEDLLWTDGFRFVSHLDEPRPLPLLLEDTHYKVLSASCDMGGVRQGHVVLALPAEGHGRRPQRNAATPEQAAGRDFSQALRQQLGDAEAQLHGVLGHLSLPLNRLLSLRPGDVLPLPNAALDRIEMTSIDGEVHGVARLGQSRGMRAVRILAQGEDRDSSSGSADEAGASGAGQGKPPLAATG